MKMTYTKFLDRDSLIISDATTKAAAIKEISEKAALMSGMEAEVINQLIWKRENMMTTGVGDGLALPHVRIKANKKPVVVVSVCKNEIEDYESQDKKPVKVLFFLMASDNDQQAYLQLLGSITERLRNEHRINEIIDNITRPSIIMRLLKKRPE